MLESRSDGEAFGGRSWAIFALSGALVLLHLVLAGHISVFGAPPHFLLALTAVFALVYGPGVGCVAGFLLGLLFDLTCSGPVGVSCLLGCVTGYVLGLNRRNVLAEEWVPSLGVFAVAALAYNAAYVILLFLFGSGIVFGLAVVGRVVAGTVLDVIVGAVVLAVASLLSAPGKLGSGGLRIS